MARRRKAIEVGEKTKEEEEIGAMDLEKLNCEISNRNFKCQMIPRYELRIVITQTSQAFQFRWNDVNYEVEVNKLMCNLHCMRNDSTLLDIDLCDGVLIDAFLFILTRV